MIITTENISKSYGKTKALDNLSLQIEKGVIHGLLGPNGAGKSTFIKILNQIITPDSGTILYDDKPVTSDTTSCFGYLPEERGLFKNMKVCDQVIFFGRLYGMSSYDAHKNAIALFRKLKIESWWNKKVEELSKGMAQKVQFVITLIHNPKLLIYDEPFSGFDPINAELIKNEILELRDKGCSVIISTHNMNSVEELCDSITLLNRSKAVLSGRVDDIRRSYTQNRIELRFKGDRALLAEKLQGRATIESEQEGVAILTHNFDISRSELITLINESVYIESVNDYLPSMNDIFIKEVAGKSNNIKSNNLTE